jgi:dienelactone hydrolase
LPRESVPIRRSERTHAVGQVFGGRKAAYPAQRGDELQQLSARQPVVHRQITRDVAHAPTQSRASATRIGTKDHDPPGTRPDQVEQHPDRRRLAGAIWAQKTHDFAGFDRER